MEVHGIPEYVISQGRVVVEKGEVKVVKGSGRFIPRQPWSDFVYSRVFQRDKVWTLFLHQCSLSYRIRGNAGKVNIWQNATKCVKFNIGNLDKIISYTHIQIFIGRFNIGDLDKITSYTHKQFFIGGLNIGDLDKIISYAHTQIRIGGLNIGDFIRKLPITNVCSSPASPFIRHT